MARLFTKHDPFNFHKVMGLLCLLHFLYRFGRFVVGGDMGFETDSTAFVVACMACHALLSGSSLVFRLPKQRIKTDRPMIWPEFRAHNILFAYRPILAVILGKLLAHVGRADLAPASGAVLILATLVLSDVISAVFESGDKTMRGMPYPAGTPELSKKQIKRFHAIAQFHATMSTFVGMDFAFATVMPVQISAFLMTLVRKGMISSRDWHNLYAFTLVLPYILLGRHLSSNPALIPFFFVTSIGARFRLQHNVNKFLVWGVTLAVSWAYLVAVEPARFAGSEELYRPTQIIVFLYGALLVKDFSRLWRNLRSMPQLEDEPGIASAAATEGAQDQVKGERPRASGELLRSRSSSATRHMAGVPRAAVA